MKIHNHKTKEISDLFLERMLQSIKDAALQAEDEYNTPIDSIWCILIRHQSIDPELGMYYTKVFRHVFDTSNVDVEKRNLKCSNIVAQIIMKFNSGCDSAAIRDLLKEAQKYEAISLAVNESELISLIKRDPLILPSINLYTSCINNGKILMVSDEDISDLSTWPESDIELYTN